MTTPNQRSLTTLASAASSQRDRSDVSTATIAKTPREPPRLIPFPL